MNLCLDIIKSRLSRLVIDGEGPLDSSGERVEPSPKVKEWSRLVDDALDQKDLVRQGRIWLKKNKSDEAAGAALVMLLSIKPTASLFVDCESWLLLHRNHESAPKLVAVLLKAEPSEKIFRLAGKYLKSSDDVHYLCPIIKAIIESPPHKGLYRKIEELLERNPKHDGWDAALISTSKHRNKRVEGLVFRWLKLNVGNPELSLLVHIAIKPSAETLEASLNWMRKGGRTADHMPGAIGFLVRAAVESNQAILPHVLSFARAWLKRNPDHEAAGSVYESIVWATRSKGDTAKAKQWYQEHPRNESAWRVVQALLRSAYWCGTQPDEYMVKEAKLLLGSATLRFQRPGLIGVLLYAHADDESIAWAKEACENQGYWWLLTALLRRAPDVETIANAEAGLNVWKDSECAEPEIVYCLLAADPKNKLALRRGRVWLKRSPENKWIKALAPLIRNAGKRKV